MVRALSSVSVDGKDDVGGDGSGDDGGRRLSADAIAHLMTSGSLQKRQGRRDTTRYTRRVDLALALEGSATAANAGPSRQRSSLRRDSIRSVPDMLRHSSVKPRASGRRASVASASPAHGRHGPALAPGPWSAEAIADKDKGRTEEEDTVGELPRTRSYGKGLEHTASQHADHVLKMQSRRRKKNQASRRRKSRRHGTKSGHKGHHRKSKLGKKKKTQANLKGGKKRKSRRSKRGRRKVSAAGGEMSKERLLAAMEVAKEAQQRDQEAAAANDGNKDEEQSAFKVRPSLQKILEHNKSDSGRRSRGSITRQASAPASDARPTVNVKRRRRSSLGDMRPTMKVKRRETVTTRRRSSSLAGVGGLSLLPRSYTFRDGDDDQGHPPARATQAQRRKRGTIVPTPSTAGSAVSLGEAATAAAVQKQRQRRASLASAAPHLVPHTT